MTEFFIEYFSISFLMIAIGVLIKIYLKKNKLSNLNQVLGVGVFWLKFFAYVLIIIGSFCTIILIITFYYNLKYEDYL